MAAASIRFRFRSDWPDADTRHSWDYELFGTSPAMLIHAVVSSTGQVMLIDELLGDLPYLLAQQRSNHDDKGC